MVWYRRKRTSPGKRSVIFSVPCAFIQRTSSTHLLRDFGAVRAADGHLLFGVVYLQRYGHPVESELDSMTFLELLQSQPTRYAGLQLLWIAAGLVAMAFVVFLDSDLYERHANKIYWANIALLTVVLFMEKGRGGMAGWFRWGPSRPGTIQPSSQWKLVGHLLAAVRRAAKAHQHGVGAAAHPGLRGTAPGLDRGSARRGYRPGVHRGVRRHAVFLGH